VRSKDDHLPPLIEINLEERYVFCETKPIYFQQILARNPARILEDLEDTNEMTSTRGQVRQAAAAPDLQFPFLELKAEFASMREEILEATERVLESQQFILGPEVEGLEADLARLVDCRYAIGCASGSDALLLALMALEIGPGDEVITPPFTFVATVGSIARVGARPVFVDISPDDFNLDPQQIAQAITRRTRAIMPVHLFGLPARMDAILEIAHTRQLPIIEDAAQSLGSRWQGTAVGGLGTLGCFSFFPSKNLGGAGDGGMITTNDPHLEHRLRVLRSHGSRTKYDYELLGLNSRLDALQAALLRVKLRHLKEWTSLRQRNADRYRAMFRELGLHGTVQLPSTVADREHVYNQFVIRTPRRDDVRTFLRERGIPTEIYYPHPLHLQPAFTHLGHRLGDFPHSEMACSEVLALPICPNLTEDQQRIVVAAIADFFEHKS
jgi:dTDP-4-amino-4,6-dideoxygalactose transaminase